MLPDRKPLLRQVDERLARAIGLAAVGGADCCDECGVTDRQRANAMRDGEGDDLESRGDFLGHLSKHIGG